MLVATFEAVKFDRGTCFHEGGHCVVAKLHDIPVVKISVDSSYGNTFFSDCDETGPLPDVLPVAETPMELIKTEMLIALAGPAAEFIDDPLKFFHSAYSGCHAGDIGYFCRFAYKHLCLNQPPVEVPAEVSAELRAQGLNKIAAATANTWLKEIDTAPAELHALFNETFQDVIKVLRLNWGRVDRIATSLMEKGTLSQREVERLMEMET